MAAENLEDWLEHLEASKASHLELGEYMLKAYGGALYPMDFLATAVLKRSMAIISGFCQMVRNRNFICAAPLVRLHLDSLLRFYAAFIVEKPHDFAGEVINGKKVSQLKDRNNRPMRDGYLAVELAREYPWVTKLYRETSGYVHLSFKHIANAYRFNRSDGHYHYVSSAIGIEDSFISDDVRIEAVAAMVEITKCILKYVHGWAYTKDNPRIVEELKKKLSADPGTQGVA